MAGSKRVYELHGSVLRNSCRRCREKYSLDFILDESNCRRGVPICPKCGAVIKPDVVLYGEGLDSDCISNSVRAISEADMLIIGGTSLVVYPAAGFVEYFERGRPGHTLALINMSATAQDQWADILINAPIGEVLGSVMDID
mgnify:CR=1 FL=1